MAARRRVPVSPLESPTAFRRFSPTLRLNDLRGFRALAPRNPLSAQGLRAFWWDVGIGSRFHFMARPTRIVCTGLGDLSLTGGTVRSP